MIDTIINKLSRLKNKFFSGIFYLVGILLLLTGLGIICFQTFIYLYQGGWTPLPLESLLVYAPDQLYFWIVEPTSWIGLHNFVKWILDVPLSFLCLIAGYLLMKTSDFIALFSDWPGAMGSGLTLQHGFAIPLDCQTHPIRIYRCFVSCNFTRWPALVMTSPEYKTLYIIRINMMD